MWTKLALIIYINCMIFILTAMANIVTEYAISYTSSCRIHAGTGSFKSVPSVCDFLFSYLPVRSSLGRICLGLFEEILLNLNIILASGHQNLVKYVQNRGGARGGPPIGAKRPICHIAIASPNLPYIAIVSPPSEASAPCRNFPGATPGSKYI